MVWSGMPARAAEVAAPMRKLCPEYLVGSMPAVARALFTVLMRKVLVKVDPLRNRSNGPVRWEGRIVMNDRIAATGQMTDAVLPK